MVHFFEKGEKEGESFTHERQLLISVALINVGTLETMRIRSHSKNKSYHAHKVISLYNGVFRALDGFRGVKTLRANTKIQKIKRIEKKGLPRAIHDLMTLVNVTLLFSKKVQSFLSSIISTVNQPSVGLQKNGRSEVVIIASPPVRGAGSRAWGAENALI